MRTLPGGLACAARDLNPDPLIKSQLHNHSCSQRLEPRRGIEPRSTGWKPVALADVLARHRGSCGARTDNLLLAGESLYQLELAAQDPVLAVAERDGAGPDYVRRVGRTGVSHS
jgi:hypothetical protein